MKEFECKDKPCVKELESVSFNCKNCIKHTSIKLTEKQKGEIMKILLKD